MFGVSSSSASSGSPYSCFVPHSILVRMSNCKSSGFYSSADTLVQLTSISVSHRDLQEEVNEEVPTNNNEEKKWTTRYDTWDEIISLHSLGIPRPRRANRSIFLTRLVSGQEVVSSSSSAANIAQAKNKSILVTLIDRVFHLKLLRMEDVYFSISHPHPPPPCWTLNIYSTIS